MGTVHSKPLLIEKNMDNQNSLEIDGYCLSGDRLTMKPCGYKEIWVPVGPDILKPNSNAVTKEQASLETSPGATGWSIETVKDRRYKAKSKPIKRQTKRKERTSNKENEDPIDVDNIGETCSTLEALKTKLERDITEKVFNSECKKSKHSISPQSSKKPTTGKDRPDSEVCTSSSLISARDSAGACASSRPCSTGEDQPDSEVCMSGNVVQDNERCGGFHMKQDVNIKPTTEQGSETNNYDDNRGSANHGETGISTNPPSIACRDNSTSKNGGQCLNTHASAGSRLGVDGTTTASASVVPQATTHVNTRKQVKLPPAGELKKEMIRFRSFSCFPEDADKPFCTRIAQAGFYFTGNQDEVKCYVCGKTKFDWRASDDPFRVHVQLNPCCEFIVNNAEVNIPLTTSTDMESRIAMAFDNTTPSSTATSSSSEFTGAKRQRTAESTNTAVSIGTEASHSMQATTSSSSAHNTNGNSYRSTSECSNNNNNSISSNNNSIDIHISSISNNIDNSNSNTGLQPESHRSDNNVSDAQTAIQPVSSSPNYDSSRRTAVPKFPRYVLLSARIASFNGATNLTIPATRLAECGLFFIGYGDCTRCHMCGIGLRHWSATDDPWVEHARWSIKCTFVLEQKGQVFIDMIKMALAYRQQIDDSASMNDSVNIHANSTSQQDSIVNTLIHQTAAQSVLEMGYDSDMVRDVIGELVQTTGRQAVTAENIMEKIFELEANPRPATNSTAPSQAPVTNTASTPKADTVKQTNKSPVASPTSSPMTSLDPKQQRKQLKSENQMLKQQSVCVKCGVNEVSIVFLPCGHLITCDQCAPSIKHCQMVNCGKYIMGTVRTYRS